MPHFSNCCNEPFVTGNICPRCKNECTSRYKRYGKWRGGKWDILYKEKTIYEHIKTFAGKHL